MPKFNVEVTFDLETSIEPEGVRFDREYHDGVTDLADNSYFRSADVETEGGEITFTVEAENEDEAENAAADIVSDGNEVTDDNGLTWLVTNVSVSVEQIEEPMTLAKAVEVLKTAFARLAEGGTITPEEQAAFAFLLDHIAAQTA